MKRTAILHARATARKVRSATLTKVTLGLLLGLLLMALALSGCSVMRPTPPVAPMRYALEAPNPTGAETPKKAAHPNALTLTIDSVRAADGLQGADMLYHLPNHQSGVFARNEWAAPPAEMLEPLLASAIQAAGIFQTVVRTPSNAAADVRLETQLLELQQDFQNQPSHVRLRLQVRAVDVRTHQALASAVFQSDIAAPRENPQGGAFAANLALQDVLRQLTALLSTVAWPRPNLPNANPHFVPNG